MRPKDLQINKWCSVCMRPVHFSCTMLINGTYSDDEPGVVDFPETCTCALTMAHTTHAVPYLMEPVPFPSHVPQEFQDAFKDGELEP